MSTDNTYSFTSIYLGSNDNELLPESVQRAWKKVLPLLQPHFLWGSDEDDYVPTFLDTVTVEHDVNEVVIHVTGYGPAASGEKGYCDGVPAAVHRDETFVETFIAELLDAINGNTGQFHSAINNH